ncbi:unnamed protein product [Calypogeia fissa]
MQSCEAAHRDYQWSSQGNTSGQLEGEHPGIQGIQARPRPGRREVKSGSQIRKSEDNFFEYSTDPEEQLPCIGPDGAGEKANLDAQAFAKEEAKEGGHGKPTNIGAIGAGPSKVEDPLVYTKNPDERVDEGEAVNIGYEDFDLFGEDS